jgi:hypothetical protein
MNTSTGKIISNRTFVNNDTAEQVDHYIDEICSDPNFLCANKQLCGSSTTIYTNKANVEKICSDIIKSSECEEDFKECVVNTTNYFDDAHGTVSTSFVNIIIPIVGAYDSVGNQKFLRLPALSGSKKPRSTDICNLCACMNRFATSPGSGDVISESSYTSPGQNTCIYPSFIEHFYYPLSIENITTKLSGTPPVKLGKYTVLNSNIIYAHSEEELLVPNLYDLLIKNGIPQPAVTSFILNVLYKNDQDKNKELQLHLQSKELNKKALINKGLFYENITFFYILLVLFILFLIITIL